MDTKQILLDYYGENARKLRRIVDKILAGFGGIAQKDEDDFYSLANEVFLDVLKRYDKEQSFEGFLYSCLSNKICSEMTKRNRKKRNGDYHAVSLDAMLCEEGSNFADMLASDVNVEREVEEKEGLFQDEGIVRYMNQLSKLQRRILKLRMEEVPKWKILQRLGISEKEYEGNLLQMKSFERTSVLYRRVLGNRNKKEENHNMTQTSEISKNTSYAVSSLIKKLDGYSIRGDHSLQRNSGQWNHLTRSEYICTLLHGYPVPAIILAEQVTPGGIVNWLIDGKQRTTNASCFEKNGFKISRNVERPLVSYQMVCRDLNGNICYENREFDVRGRYYEDLPEELKERFNDYAFPVVQYLNCSDEDIEYHIRRYNAAKPVSAAQKGITHLGEKYAKAVKDLTEHSFFKDKGNYRISEFANGTIERVVIESMMVICFLPDWKKRQEDMCRYLKKNVKAEQFDAFAGMLDRLVMVLPEDVAVMFDSKNSFLWFGLFAGISEMGLSDEGFVEFLREFQSRLHGQNVDGITFDSLNEKSTKDKNVVIRKLKVLEGLVQAFLKDERV